MSTLATKTGDLLGLKVPPQLGNIAEAVENSRRILDLPDNWDDEGSPAYSTITWERACVFQLRSALGLLEKCGMVAPTPSIAHGPKGSADIYWRSSSFTLLLNVPSPVDQPIDYFGCKPDGTEIKGKLDPALSNHWLLMWMTE